MEEGEPAEAPPPIPIPPSTARNTNAPRHYYPSPPQTARSCRFIKTRPGTTRVMPYTCRKISSFATPLVQLRTIYSQMDIQLHSFVANCNIEAISPELMLAYKRVDIAYDTFCTQANILLSSQDPNATPRAAQATSAIAKISDELVTHWVAFIKLLNQTTAQGSTPFFQIIAGRLSRILSMFRDLNERFKVGMLRLALSREGMRRVDGEIILLRRECNQKYREEAQMTIEFSQKVKNVIQKVENIFKNSHIKATMCTAEIMRLKSELHIEASDLSTNVDSMLEFGNSAGRTRAMIAKVNEAFNYLFQLMRLPYELKLHYEEEDISKENDQKLNNTQNVENENEKQNNQCENETENSTNISETHNPNNYKPPNPGSMKVFTLENLV
ncbi:hypothetical protein TRFO_24371 [Tritrichomonas foetus]|uniref:Uncharacterized protein n=1 Tax=Tritrichomonas foetus TaxID=1144522 RepID=A0A1J4K885_9EUKA|nr:hypothetical protein TRFO_24371 [Tritrichomonas foetus]|eukprot:OHT07419.1 hypothetical protein TRFO_24371 [Tritrichomonas foetus]